MSRVFGFPEAFPEAPTCSSQCCDSDKDMNTSSWGMEATQVKDEAIDLGSYLKLATIFIFKQSGCISEFCHFVNHQSLQNNLRTLRNASPGHQCVQLTLSSYKAQGTFCPCCGAVVVLLLYLASDSLILAKKEDFTITFWIGSKFTSGTLKDKLFIYFLFLIPLHVRGQCFLLCSSGTIETELSNENMLLPSTAHLYPAQLSRACLGSR